MQNDADFKCVSKFEGKFYVGWKLLISDYVVWTYKGGSDCVGIYTQKDDLKRFEVNPDKNIYFASDNIK